MINKRKPEKEFNFEYNCFFRRLMPWKNIAETSWGAGWVKIAPEEATTPHQHHMHEIFIIISGKGRISIEQNISEALKGDLFYIPPQTTHSLKNCAKKSYLNMICIWWTN